METSTHQAALESERAKLTTELQTIAIFNETTGDWLPKPDGPADDADTIDAADHNEDSVERQAVVADLESRYRNVERALAKIADGSYGVCELCGQEIETNRLEANPAARTCIADRDRESELTI